MTLPVHDIEVLGALKSPDPNKPHLILSATPCAGCADRRSIYIASRDGRQLQQFVFPGRVVDSKAGAMVLEARAFFGRCLPDREDVYVVFQKDVVDKKRGGRRYKVTEPSVFVAAPSSEQGLDEKLTELRTPAQLAARQKSALDRVKRKECFEIAGKNRAMARKPFDLKPRLQDTDEADEDEDAKEPATEGPAGIAPKSDV